MSATNQPPTCPTCPGEPILLPGEDSYYVCYKCGYTSSIAATFYDERDEMLQQMDANERYSGLLKDNMLGAARLMRSSTGVVYSGQAEMRSQIYRQARAVSFFRCVQVTAVKRLYSLFESYVLVGKLQGLDQPVV